MKPSLSRFGFTFVVTFTAMIRDGRQATTVFVTRCPGLKCF